MIDFELWDDIKKTKIIDTHIYKARNILSVQKGGLKYDLEAGVDKDYFVNNDIKFKRNAFISYLTQELIFQNVTVVNNTEDLTNAMVEKISINVKSTVSTEKTGGIF
jgi:hypothetical protein